MSIQGERHCLKAKGADLSGSSFADVSFSGWDHGNVRLAAGRCDNENTAGLRIPGTAPAGKANGQSRLNDVTLSGVEVTELLAAHGAAQEAK